MSRQADTFVVPVGKLSREQRRKLERERKLPAGARPKARSGSSTVLPVDQGYPEFGWRDELARLEADRRKIRDRENLIAAQALAAGCTFSELARALGVSRQTAHMRFRHLRPVVAGHRPHS